jgi:hypothetical protein
MTYVQFIVDPHPIRAPYRNNSRMSFGDFCANKLINHRVKPYAVAGKPLYALVSYPDKNMAHTKSSCHKATGARTSHWVMHLPHLQTLSKAFSLRLEQHDPSQGPRSKGSGMDVLFMGTYVLIRNLPPAHPSIQ